MAQQLQEYQAALKSQQDKFSKQITELETQRLKLQQQSELLRQEKQALIEDNKSLRAQIWTVVEPEREDKMQAGKTEKASSSIPTMVESHRVTTETLDENTDTIYDDVALPPTSPSSAEEAHEREKRDLRLQIQSLRGHVEDLTGKLRDKDREVCIQILHVLASS